jgi:hypothetical protein
VEQNPVFAGRLKGCKYNILLQKMNHFGKNLFSDPFSSLRALQLLFLFLMHPFPAEKILFIS